MSLPITSAVIAALLGSALIGGVFFAFSSFIMNALARVPSSEGMAAMQSINVVVINRSFLGAFMGTAALSLFFVVYALVQWGESSSMYFLVGALLYFCGTFLVTIFGNVPLNDQLAALSTADQGAVEVWERYVERWTRLNSIRALASVAAALVFTLGLID
jgi:uncharacterized membrane protein